MNGQPSPLPSIDALLRSPAAEVLLVRFGRPALTGALRHVLACRRSAGAFGAPVGAIINEVADLLARERAVSQRPVFNLTGTVLHTNLGRAPMPPEAAEAAAEAMRTPPAWNTTWQPGGAVSGTRMWRRCCAGSPGPRRRPWSTTMPPR